MKVLLSLNENVHDLFVGKLPYSSYGGSLNLVDAFQKKGHDVKIVHPTQLNKDSSGNVYFNNFLTYDRGSYQSHNESIPATGDVFFVRSLGEDASSPDMSTRFIESLYDIEKNMAMFNDAESTSYEIKSKQKTLDLPYISEFNPASVADLEDILSSGVELIAKPDVGFQRRGISYLNSPSQAKNYEGKFDTYCFEQFMPEQIEKRYLFLDDELLFNRIVHLEGAPGKEKEVSAALVDTVDADELAIAYDAFKQTGMFYGSVDFRQGKILEINGSGSGTSGLLTNGRNVYDVIVSSIEQKLYK